jgi:hypothetical protein
VNIQSLKQRPFPNGAQKLLLKAALFDRNEAFSSWEKWKSTVDFEEDVDHGSYRLLPLVYDKLHKNGYSDVLSGRLKGIYKRSWMENQQIFHHASEIIKNFSEAQIPVIAMKGIPLSFLVYDNPATRPMSDADILVPYQKAGEAVALLKKEGYKPANEAILEHDLLYGRGMGFTDDNGRELDLHWRAMPDSIKSAKKSDFWDQAAPMNVMGANAFRFSYTDELLQTIVHGLRKNPEPPIRWVADAFLLIKYHGEEIEWNRLLKYARRYKVLIQLKEGLNYLVNEFKIGIPADVMDKLNRCNPGYAERVVYRHAQRIGDNRKKVSLPERVYTFYARFLRQSAESNFVRLHVDFINYSINRLSEKTFKNRL